MNDPISRLKKDWVNEKERADKNKAYSSSEIIEKGNKKRRNAIFQHIQLILILSVTLMIISVFFVFVASLNDLLSKIGIGLMTGTLIIRILLEVYSIIQIKNIDFSDSMLSTTNLFMNYHKRRKQFNGLVMYIILAFYTIGFYLLTPEFSQYFSLSTLVLLDLSYLIAALIVTFFIRMGLRKENKLLTEIQQLHIAINE